MKNYTYRKFDNLSWRQKLIDLIPHGLLLLFLPRTYYRFFKTLFLSKDAKNIIGFSPRMALTLSWYLRIAECVKKYGVKGYVYEDGLGFALKDRFWLNSFALYIYNKLKLKRYTILTSLILVISFIYISYREEKTIIGLLILFLAGGSPLFLLPFFRLAKPEILSWAFFPLSIYSFMNEQFITTFVLCSLISFLNFTTMLFLGFSIILFGLLSSKIYIAIFVLSFAGIKILYDFIPFFKNVSVRNFSEALGGRKTESRSDEFLRFKKRYFYVSIIYIIFLLALLLKGIKFNEFSLISIPIFFLIFNRTIYRFADDGSIYRFMFVLATVYAVLFFHPIVLAGYILLIYLSPRSLWGTAAGKITDFPYMQACSYKETEEYLKSKFLPIRNNARICFELDNTEKAASGFRMILVYLEYYLLKKGIELLPSEWLRVTNLEYFMTEYIKVNGKSGRETIEEKCKEMGVDYIMAHSKEFIENLKDWNYPEVVHIESDELKRNIWNYSSFPDEDLVVFEVPFETELITPQTELQRYPNKIGFFAPQQGIYTIKYNYHLSWKAYQFGNKLKIERSKGRLKFMEVTVPATGKIEMKFESGWL